MRSRRAVLPFVPPGGSSDKVFYSRPGAWVRSSMQSPALHSSRSPPSSSRPGRRCGPIVVALLVVASVLFASVGGVASARSGLAAPTDTSVAPADDAREPEASFDANAFEEHRGDVVDVPIRLYGANAATVRIAGNDGAGDDEATVTVHDEDGDDRVTLSFNTYLAGNDDSRAFEAAGDDEVTVRNSTSLAAPPAAGTYDLSVAAGTDADRPADDAAALTLSEPSTTELTTWAAVGVDRSDLADSDAIAEAKQSGSLARTDDLSERDLLVVELRASGLSGVLAAEDGATVSERFFDLLDRSGVELTAEESPETVNLEEDPIRLDLASPEATSVVTDPDEDTYYLVVDVETAQTDEGYHPGIRTGDAFDVQFTVAENATLPAASERSGETRFQLVERSASIEGLEPLYVDLAPNQTITGQTNVPAGSEVTVVVRAPLEDFTAKRTATVDADGRFAATFDFDGVPEGTTIRVQVRFDGRDLLDSPVEGEVDDVPADVEVLEATRSGVVEVRVNATLGVGGFVVLRANSTDGHLVGRSSYLSPGTHENVTVTGARSQAGVEEFAVVLYRDADDDYEFDHDSGPYLENGSTVATTTEIPLRTDASTPTPDSSTPTPDPATPTPGPATPTSDSTATETSTDSPGFGVLGAILAVALVAGWRRHGP